MDHASLARDRRCKRSRPPQADLPGDTEDSATSEPLAQQQPALEASPQPPKRRRQVPQQNTLEGVIAPDTADAATMGAENTEPVPQRWVALEPSPRPAKQQRRQQEQDTVGTEATTIATAAAAGTEAAEPVPRRWVTLEGSPRPTKRQRTAQTEASSSQPVPPVATVTKKRKRREGPPGRSNKKQKLRLSIHINPWTINNSNLRLLSERASARLRTAAPGTGNVRTAASATALQLSSPPP